MLGPFRGSVSTEDVAGGRISREHAPLDVVKVLAKSGRERPYADADVAPPRIGVRVEEGVVVHGVDLDASSPLGVGSRIEKIAALACAADVIAALHREGRAHGDLREETVRVSDAGPIVIVPPPLDAAELVSARVAAGAPLRDVGFAAPEVVLGSPASPASDVYSLAALAYAALTGRPPLGSIDARTFVALGIGAPHALGAALAEDPARRPPIESLQRGLHACLEQLSPATPRPSRAEVFQRVTGPRRDAHEPRSKEDSDSRAILQAWIESRATTPRQNGPSENARSSMTLLSFVLALGGVSVFLGVLALAVTSWSSVGPTGQLGALAALTLAMFGGGVALSAKSYERSGFTLQLVALELCWAVAYMGLEQNDLGRSAVAWMIASCVIGTGHALFAAWRGSVVVGISSVLGLTVTAATLGLVLDSDTRYGTAVYAGFVAAAYAGAALATRRTRRRALSVPFGVAAVIWAALSTIAMMALLGSAASPAGRVFEIAWPYAIAAAGIWLGRRTSGAPLTLSRELGAAILCLAPSLQAAAFAWDAPSWWAACAVGVAATSTCAMLGVTVLGRIEKNLVAPLVAIATLWWIATTAYATVSLVLDPGALGVIWPYATAGLAGALAIVARHRAKIIASLLHGGASDGAAVPEGAITLARGYALAILFAAPSTQLLASTWRSPDGWGRDLSGLAIGVAGALLAALVFDKRGRGWHLAFALLALAWSLGTSVDAIQAYRENPGLLAIAWPYLAAAIVAGAGWIIGRAPLGESSKEQQHETARLLGSTWLPVLIGAPSIQILLSDWSESPWWAPCALGLVAALATTVVCLRLQRPMARVWAAVSASLTALWALGTTASALMVLAEAPTLMAVVAPYAVVAACALAALGFDHYRKEQAMPLHTAILRVTAGCVLLATPSLQILGTSWAGTPWWTPALLGVACTAAAAAVVHGVARRTTAWAALPFAGVALLWVAATTLRSIAEVALSDDYLSFGSLWPYAVAAVAYAIAVSLERSNVPRASLGKSAALGFAVASAGATALVAHDRFGFAVLAAMVGLAFLGRIVLTGDRAKALALDSTLWVAIGLGAALGVPAILCLARTLGRADGNVLAVASNTAPPIAHLGLFLCASAALVALGALGPRGEEGAGRARTLELWGTLAFLGVVGTLSLAYVATDVLYASILFIGGAALVLVGLARRRAFMVSSATLTLLALVFVQYFAKLHDKVPWGLLALGFGLSLLALAILFERKVKPFLPELRRWS